MVAVNNIWYYFRNKLDADPQDETLRDLPINSGCGRDCKRIIDAYAKLKAKIDPHPHCVDPLVESARACISIYWHG